MAALGGSGVDGAVIGRVQAGALPLRTEGVGSNRIHPAPVKYNSGQACASLTETSHSPSGVRVPGRKPTATRAGIPRVRAMTAIVEA